MDDETINRKLAAIIYGGQIVEDNGRLKALVQLGGRLVKKPIDTPDYKDPAIFAENVLFLWDQPEIFDSQEKDKYLWWYYDAELDDVIWEVEDRHPCKAVALARIKAGEKE